MQRWMKMTTHINPETGEHGKCTATKKLCPYQKQGEELGIETHFRTVREAKIAGEHLKESMFGEFKTLDKNQTEAALRNDVHLLEEPIQLSAEELKKNEEFLALYNDELAGENLDYPTFGLGFSHDDWQKLYDSVFEQIIKNPNYLATGSSFPLGTARRICDFLSNPNLPVEFLDKAADLAVSDSTVLPRVFEPIMTNPNVTSEITDKLLDAAQSGEYHKYYRIPNQALGHLSLRQLEKSEQGGDFLKTAWNTNTRVYDDPMNDLIYDSKEIGNNKAGIFCLRNPNLPPELIEKLVNLTVECRDGSPHYGHIVMSNLMQNPALTREQIQKLFYSYDLAGELQLDRSRIIINNLSGWMKNNNFTKADHDYLLSLNDKKINADLRRNSRHFIEAELLKAMDDVKISEKYLKKGNFDKHGKFSQELHNPHATPAVVKKVRERLDKHLSILENADPDRSQWKGKLRWNNTLENTLQYGYGMPDPTAMFKRNMLSPKILSNLSAISPVNMDEIKWVDVMKHPDLPLDSFVANLNKFATEYYGMRNYYIKDVLNDPNLSAQRLQALAKSPHAFIREAVKNHPNTSMKTLLEMAANESADDETDE